MLGGGFGPAALDGVRPDVLARVQAGMFHVPGMQAGGGVIPAVPHIAPALQQQGPQALLAQFLGGPPAADAGADHDGIVRGLRTLSLAGIDRWCHAAF